MYKIRNGDPPLSEPVLQAQKHLLWVLDVLLDLDEEGDSFPAIEKTVIVCEREVHHRSNLDLAVDSDWLVLDGVKTEDSGLRKIDDRGTEHGAEDTTVGDGECATGHVLNGELVVTCLHVLVTIVKIIALVMLTFLPREAISFSMPIMSMASALRTTGVTRPFSVATATEMST